jgi:hypothetical protein
LFQGEGKKREGRGGKDTPIGIERISLYYGFVVNYFGTNPFVFLYD